MTLCSTPPPRSPCPNPRRLLVLVDFLDIMCEKLVLPSLSVRVRHLRNAYNTATMVYNKFQRLWTTVLSLGHNQLVMDFAWSLFVYLKGAYLPKCTRTTDATCPRTAAHAGVHGMRRR